ncbi:MAG TPA: heme exporter protein CcmB [bacterium]|nr:heme exporter protein CcmB [bacterium]
MRTLLAVLRKDLMVEGRSRDLIPAMALLALLLLALSGSAGIRGAPSSIVVWIAVVVSAALGLTRSFGLETDQEQIHGLRMAPVDPGWIFLGKAAANFLLVAVVEVLALGAAVVFLDLPVGGRLAPLSGVLALGGAAIVSLGTLLGALLAVTRLREALLPLLLLPLSAPAVMAASGATVKLLGTRPEPVTGEVVLLAAFLLLFVALGLLLFEYVIED